MPIPLAVLAATSAVPAIAQGITGIQQSRRAKDILNGLQRPTYNIPSAATDALGTARTLASSNQLPNQVQAEQRLDQNTANALYNINQNATSGTEALAALTGVYSNQMGAETELAGQGAVFTNQQNQNLIKELNKFATYQDNAFDYNVNQPFQERRAEGQALAASGMQNKYNALKDVAGIASTAMLGMNGLGGAKTTPDTSTQMIEALGSDALASNLTKAFDMNNMSHESQHTSDQLSGLVQEKSAFNPPEFNMFGNKLFNTTIDINARELQKIAALLNMIGR